MQMITKSELLELLRGEDGINEMADSILARIGQPEGSAKPTKFPHPDDNPRPPATGINFDEVGRKLAAFAERLGVKPRVLNQSSTWAIRIGRNSPSYDVLELANALLGRVEALDAKLDRRSWDMVISSAGDED